MKTQQINWPAGEFTLTQVFESLSPRMSRTSIQIRANRDLRDQKITQVAKRRGIGRGRHSVVYKRVELTKV